MPTRGRGPPPRGPCRSIALPSAVAYEVRELEFEVIALLLNLRRKYVSQACNVTIELRDIHFGDRAAELGPILRSRWTTASFLPRHVSASQMFKELIRESVTADIRQLHDVCSANA